MNDKIKCSCGYETEYRCRLHPSRPAHILWAVGWLCHECETLMHNTMRSGYSDHTAGLMLLEKNFILCPGCAHEQALFEDAERELDKFLNQAPRLEELEERLV